MNGQWLEHFPRSVWYRVATIVVLLIVPTVVYYVIIDTLDLIPAPGLFFFELKNDIQGCLYFAALAFAAVAFSWRGFAVTWLAAFLIHLPRTLTYTLSTESLLHNLGFWFLPLSAGAVITLERHWRAAQRQIEQERQQERELYIQQILAAQEEERLRISKEIHDETLQDLLALAYVADAMLKECHGGDGRLGEKATSMRDTSLRVARELRRISSDLRPSTLDHLGLVPFLRWLAERTGSEAAIPTRVTVAGQPWLPDKQAEIAIFRIVQEALTNVRRHSGATEAWVKLDFKAGSLKLQIGDNGQGFSPRLHTNRLASEGHLGLLGIRERVTALGGTLRLQSRPTMGTVLYLSIPAPVAAAAVSAATSANR
ncbi:MAG: sensor histidine kinase [Dehalococcoidia bacterium]|nr:sensor histidine kinase [Dehalococcoidia bacterium]